MSKYDPKQIEPKWQKYWQEKQLYETKEQPGKPKQYVLDMFPYPSGDGLHVGHPKGYIATDVYSRMKRMQGFNVLHPMGWDAFGLPAENFAIKNKLHPQVAVQKNINRFKEQLGQIGFNYDWTREINTTDPDYYKWTQWIFLKMLENGLAYESHEPIYWCPSCQTGLAMEDLEEGKCERCGSVVERRPMRQWVLKITQYADRLLEGLEQLDWPESIKESQRNWIGRSEGATLKFAVAGMDEHIEVFTTRPDTLFGATYLVLAPEHPFVHKLLRDDAAVIQNKSDVKTYVETAINKPDLERQQAGEREKTGIELQGIHAINPATKKEIPVWIADYVLGGYGTGAIMAVPAHDERDFAFAQKFKLPITQVITADGQELPYTGTGPLMNSGEFDDMASEEAKTAITEAVGGTATINYRLRDWVFSRQRYWGEPIPIIHCNKCGTVPVPEDQLPVALPEVEHYEPTGTGESPLAAIEEWVNTTCPKCEGTAKRETNTMPQWAGSSWYYLRYIDPQNSGVFADKQKEKYWMPVDMYVGGAEHATRHLIYARFWHMFLYDQGHVSTPEPFSQLQHVGLILAEDGRKMSKRWGNVINPDDIVDQYGADTLRVYEMFMGPFNQAVAWNTASINGARRFLERVWNVVTKHAEQNSGQLSKAAEVQLHRTVKQVTEETAKFKFNTSIAAMMELLNVLEKENTVPTAALEKFILLVAPYAPHIGEELWHMLGHEETVVDATWPAYDEVVLQQAQVVVVVQVNGKVRGQLEIAPGVKQSEVETQAKDLPNVTKYLEGKPNIKVVYIPNRLINFVVVA